MDSCPIQVFFPLFAPSVPLMFIGTTTTITEVFTYIFSVFNVQIRNYKEIYKEEIQTRLNKNINISFFHLSKQPAIV